ncbi:MAG: amidohydrolase [Candidatus Sumerlaeia bacterium]|nr:amidohydrolase [Candidatus Sumerlaeia bacterium]
MRATRLGFAGLLVVSLLAAFPAERACGQQFDEEIARLVEQFAPEAIAHRQHLHQNPELSNREFQTAARVAEHLRALGLEVRTGIAHTGVVAILRGGLPGGVVALRADMDALPVTESPEVPYPHRSTVQTEWLGRVVGVSHACGHDIHVASLLGAASVLVAMRERIPGTVMLIFQPAEEGAPAGEEGGAKLMLEEGLFDEIKPDAVMAFHTNAAPPQAEGGGHRLGRVTYVPGPAMAAATTWHAVVRGRSAHGAAPHLGVDPIVVGSQIVLALQTIRSRSLSPFAPNVLTVGIFRGGDRTNIIPSQVELAGTIRTFDDGVLDTIEERMRAIFDGTTRAAGATYDLEFDRGYPVLINDVDLTRRMVPTLERVAGADMVSEASPVTGAEDFAFFSNVVPGFYFRIGAVPDGMASGGLHTETFYASDDTVPLGMQLLSTLALDFLSQ